MGTFEPQNQIKYLEEMNYFALSPKNPQDKNRDVSNFNNFANGWQWRFAENNKKKNNQNSFNILVEK